MSSYTKFSLNLKKITLKGYFQNMQGGLFGSYIGANFEPISTEFLKYTKQEIRETIDKHQKEKDIKIKLLNRLFNNFKNEVVSINIDKLNSDYRDLKNLFKSTQFIIKHVGEIIINNTSKFERYENYKVVYKK